jgi:hypothetical protein
MAACLEKIHTFCTKYAQGTIGDPFRTDNSPQRTALKKFALSAHARS